MLRNAVLLVVTAALAVAFAGCGGGDATPGTAVAVKGGEFRRVTPAELQEMLKSKDFPLINVHIPYEGELTGTDAFVPFDLITQRSTRDADLALVLPVDGQLTGGGVFHASSSAPLVTSEDRRRRRRLPGGNGEEGRWTGPRYRA